MSILKPIIDWTTATFQPLGMWGLFILAFMESSFFPIPPDILLIVLCLAQPESSLGFALVCTIGSVLGALLGYGIGYVGEEAVLKRFVSKAKIGKVHKLFNKYEGWAIFIAGFTPIPYKIFTIAAGLFYVKLYQFVIASIIGRGMRFFVVAGLIMIYGEAIITFLDSYFNVLSLIVTVLIVVGVFVYHKVKKGRAEVIEPA